MYLQVSTGPWPDQPKHLQEMEAAAAAKQKGDVGQDHRLGPAAAGNKGSKGSNGSGPAVVDQVLTLNNELFMVPEALFRWAGQSLGGLGQTRAGADEGWGDQQRGTSDGEEVLRQACCSRTTAQHVLYSLPFLPVLWGSRASRHQQMV
jgi:hypothetical protein